MMNNDAPVRRSAGQEGAAAWWKAIAAVKFREAQREKQRIWPICGGITTTLCLLSLMRLVFVSSKSSVCDQRFRF